MEKQFSFVLKDVEIETAPKARRSASISKRAGREVSGKFVLVAWTAVSCQPSLTLARPLHAFVLSPVLPLIVSKSRRQSPHPVERHQFSSK